MMGETTPDEAELKKTQVFHGFSASECPICQAPILAMNRPFCPSDGTLLSPFRLGERYLVEEHLGSDEVTLMFGGRHEVLGRPVAIKILRANLVQDSTQENRFLREQRFLREARIVSQLHHENIVDVFDFGRDERLDICYLVMERLRGKTLAETIRTSAPMAWPEAASILLQVCRALVAAQSQNVAHRALTPRNIMLVESSSRQDLLVKLCDFGLARLATGEDHRITATNAMMESPAYAAPEQIRGDEAQGHAVDLYAWGVIAYEMLIGRLPHESTNPIALIASKLNDNVPSMRELNPILDLPESLERIIIRCLARDPAQRPRSAAEVEQVLVAEIMLATSAAAPVQEAMALGESLIGQSIGSYRIISLLGTGGSATVYLAKHSVIGSQAAVKVLLPEIMVLPSMVDRFVQEAKIASAIGSPHLPHYFDFGRLANGQPYAIMEYIEGETLAQRLNRAGPFSLDETSNLLGQVAEAMSYAHDAHVVHRDLKPDNLCVVEANDGSPLVKVLDFGIAKVIPPQGTGRITQVGLLFGTPFYCAPEQVSSSDVSHSADIYALGVTAFELLTSHLPFEGNDAMSAKTSQDAPSVRKFRPELPAVVEKTLAKMLARDPKARPASMMEVRKIFETWSETPQSTMQTALLPASRMRLWVAILTLLVIVAVVTAVFSIKPLTSRPEVHHVR